MEIEQRPVVLGKKVLNIMRILILMLRKGISKSKLMLDAHMMLKRGKLAGKAALRSFMLHHHHSPASSATAAADPYLSFITPGNPHYEFSCSSSPAYPNFFHNYLIHNKRNKNRKADEAENVLEKVLEILNDNEKKMGVAASPLVFGRSPMVRQLRITDSPYPVRNSEEDAVATAQVNKAAEDFISKFYKDLKLQTSTMTPFESPYHDCWN